VDKKYHSWIDYDADGELPDNGIKVHIRSWYPAWVVRLKVKYALWKEGYKNG